MNMFALRRAASFCLSFLGTLSVLALGSCDQPGSANAPRQRTPGTVSGQSDDKQREADNGRSCSGKVPAELQRMGALVRSSNGTVREVLVFRDRSSDGEIISWSNEDLARAKVLLEQCPGLTTLSVIAMPEITDDGIRHLSDLTQLKRLELATSASGSGLKSLTNLQELQVLSLRMSGLSDAGIGCVPSFPKLVELDIGYTQVTAKGIRALEHFPRIHKLGVDALPLTDESMDCLRGLSNLKELNLSYTGISSAGLQYVGRKKKLRRLWLAGTRVDTGGMAHLQGLDKLEELVLDGLKLTDEDLKDISRLASLKRLSLVGTHITDAGLERLVDLPNLERVWVRGTATTSSGLATLQQNVRDLIVDGVGVEW